MINALEKTKYIFDAVSKSITFNVIDFDVRKIASITNKTTGDIIYAPAIGTGYLGTVNGTTLTLEYDTSAQSNTDILEILYDWESWYHKSHEIDFTTAIPSGVDASQLDTIAIGSGMSVSQTLGKLVINAGIVANSETIFRSKIPFTRELLLTWASKRSQAIVNNNFYVMLADKVGDNLSISVNTTTAASITIPFGNQSYDNLSNILQSYPTGLVGMKMFIGGLIGVTGSIPGQYAIASAVVNTGVSIILTFTVAGWAAGSSGTCCVFGWNAIYTNETTATATTQNFESLRNGWNSSVGDIAYTTNSSVTGHGCGIYKTSDIISFSDALVASAAIPTVRATRLDSIPAEDINLYTYIIARNGSVAPASTTTWTVGGIRMEESNAQPNIITGVRSFNGSASALPVVFPSAQAVTVSSGTITTVTTVTGATITPKTPTALNVNSAATTNGTVVKATAGVLYNVVATNTGASAAYLKLYNIAAVTVGTTIPVITVMIPASGHVSVPFGTMGHTFAAGICLGITGAVADTDTTAVAASQVKVLVSFI